jgi:hypothetical protein
MDIQPSEISKILKEEIKNFGSESEILGSRTSPFSWRWYCQNLWIR